MTKQPKQKICTNLHHHWRKKCSFLCVQTNWVCPSEAQSFWKNDSDLSLESLIVTQVESYSMKNVTRVESPRFSTWLESRYHWGFSQRRPCISCLDGFLWKKPAAKLYFQLILFYRSSHPLVKCSCQRCTEFEIFDSDSAPASAEYTPTRRIARDFDGGGANNNQVSTFKYIMPLVFKASSITYAFFWIILFRFKPAHRKSVFLELTKF